MDVAQKNVEEIWRNILQNATKEQNLSSNQKKKIKSVAAEFFKNLLASLPIEDGDSEYLGVEEPYNENLEHRVSTLEEEHQALTTEVLKLRNEVPKVMEEYLEKQLEFEAEVDPNQPQVVETEGMDYDVELLSNYKENLKETIELVEELKVAVPETLQKTKRVVQAARMVAQSPSKLEKIMEAEKGTKQKQPTPFTDPEKSTRKKLAAALKKKAGDVTPQ